MDIVNTIKGNLTYENGYGIFHVWGELKGKQISKFYATKNIKNIQNKYPHPKVYINVASTNLQTEYEIL